MTVWMSSRSISAIASSALQCGMGMPPAVMPLPASQAA
jgi:hypothetical protein